MPDERPFPSPVNEIDAELRRLLSIEPSAAFVSRVRQRIGERTATRPSRVRWWIGAAAAPTVILVLMIVFQAWRTAPVPRDAGPTSTKTQPPVAARAPEIHTPAPAPSAEPQHAARRRSRRVSPVTTRHSAAGPAPAEVLVSRDQLRAIARLQQLIAAGHLDEKDLPPADEAADATMDIRPAPLTIAPLTLPPVESVAPGEEPRQERER